jgi:hypothetical protein
MWKIIRLFFKQNATANDLPLILKWHLIRICRNEQMDPSFIFFRRKSVNYFEMEYLHSSTCFGFFIDSLEID